MYQLKSIKFLLSQVFDHKNLKYISNQNFYQKSFHDKILSSIRYKIYDCNFLGLQIYLLQYPYNR